jgi:hypothetical protein
MQLTLSGQLQQFLRVMQGSLFPALQEQLGPLTDKHQQLVAVLSMIQIEAMVASCPGGVGRPSADRRSIARAFVAKAVFNMRTTRQLLDRLPADVSLRRICGWESRREIPHESQFSRTFADTGANAGRSAAGLQRGQQEKQQRAQETWVGYKLHLDVADGQIPISCILTSASLHDSQTAIPRARLSAQRVTNLYDLMDSAYDAQAIHEHRRGLGHIPIIDVHPRRDQAQKAELQAEEKRRKLLNYSFAEQVRYRERATVERVNARLKDEFGGRMVRVRGNAKVMCHLMFGIVALAADQILRLIT